VNYYNHVILQRPTRVIVIDSTIFQFPAISTIPPSRNKKGESHTNSDISASDALAARPVNHRTVKRRKAAATSPVLNAKPQEIK
jgi:hypothetical protein